MINTILWDFDGVLLESNEIRDTGFKEVLKKFPEDQVNKLLKFHRKNGGLSRYVKFRYFYESIRGEDVSDKKILDLSEEFSKLMRVLLINKKLIIEESLNFVIQNFEKYDMHVVSGSDQNELRFLCKELEISKYFISILGSPTPKKELVENVLKEYKYPIENTLFIGDSINDYDAAKHNDILFMGFNNYHLEKKSDIILY
tara:strand:- start:17017 stop:17616 length:600 start_codon:yes stop_codon:yes gene_type:complete